MRSTGPRSPWLQRSFLAGCLAILVAAALIVPLPWVVERPGRLLSLAGCVDVNAPSATPVDGDFLLTSVNVRRAVPAGLALAIFDPSAKVLPAQTIIPPGTGDAEYFSLQREVFAQEARLAAALGLQAAGFAIDPDAFVGDGALVTGTLAGLPAEGVLRQGDVIVRANGQTVGTVDELQALVSDEPLRLRVQRNEELLRVELTPQRTQVEGATRTLIGVQVETLNARIDLPVPVDVQSGRIGGPSAGLMIALTVYDKAADDVDLASGRVVAGTGTLSLDGRVGTIGGIRLKALGAANQGADVFVAPAAQADVARQALAGSDVAVIGAATLTDAVESLRTSATERAATSDPPSPQPCPLSPAA